MTGVVRREAETTAETEAEMGPEVGKIEAGIAENEAEVVMKEEGGVTVAVEIEAVAAQTPEVAVAVAVPRVVRRKPPSLVKRMALENLQWKKVRSLALPRMSPQ